MVHRDKKMNISINDIIEMDRQIVEHKIFMLGINEDASSTSNVTKQVKYVQFKLTDCMIK